MKDVPAAVLAKARDAGASAWLENLPRLVGDLCREWGLRPGVAFGDATEAYVVSVTRRDGTPAVLKLLVPRRSAAAAHEITVLRLAAGEGCCRLYAYDVSRGALLLEHLGPAMSELNLPQPRRLEILTDLASALWRPTGADLPTAVTRAEWQASYISRKWSELGEPCSRAAVDQALRAAESRRRAWDQRRAVLIHGDVHQWNALSVPHERAHAERATETSADEGVPAVAGAALLGVARHRSRPAEAGEAGHHGRQAVPAGRGVLDGGGAKAGEADRTAQGQEASLLGCTTRRDAHGADRGEFRLVDPDGLIAEPEADLGVLMREDPVELMAGDPWERARWLAARTETDPVAIWEWGLVERVTTGLVLTVAGVQPIAADMLAAADEISRRG